MAAAATLMHRLEDALLGVNRSKATAILAMTTAAVVEFGNAANLCHGDCSPARWAWAVAVGVVGFVLGLGRLALFFAARPEALAVPDMVLGAALVVLWSFGAGFNMEAGAGVFGAAGNGFFATWLALLASAWFAAVSLRHQLLTLAAAAHLAGPWPVSLTICGVASLVELAQGADLCRHDACGAYNAYAVAAGVVSLATCVAALLVERHRPREVVVQTLLALFLVAWWAVGAGVNTSVRGAFPTPAVANGYFFTWIAFGAAVVRLADCLGVHAPAPAPAPATPEALAAAGAAPVHPV